MKTEATKALRYSDFLAEAGSWFLVDGQYGSTGKGLAASAIAEACGDLIDVVTSNAGPNSGHTFYAGDEKVVLKQLPSTAVYMAKTGIQQVPIYLNAGAIIDPAILGDEVHGHLGREVRVHPSAAMITTQDFETETGMVGAIGSTAKGTGSAQARKIMRGQGATIGQAYNYIRDMMKVEPRQISPAERVLVEVSQGFSLGINQRFYPYCTSRECTVGQAMSDAGLHPSTYRGCMQVMRTFPIRVHGNSGPVYYDQEELSWDQFDVEPERTTVTNKVRRIFTWSTDQYVDSLLANRPEYLFLNFCNYLERDKVDEFVYNRVYLPYVHLFGKDPKSVLLGWGPKVEDITVWQ